MTMDTDESETIPEKLGIYFLHDGKKVIYVGQTANLKRRLSSYIPSKEVEEKIKKVTDIEQLQAEIRQKQKIVSIIDTKILIVETFLKFIPPATATLLITSIFFGLQGQIANLLTLIYMVTGLIATLIVVFYVCYKIRCRYGDKSYELNTEINESFKQIERLSEKKAFDEIVLNDVQYKILNYLYNLPEAPDDIMGGSNNIDWASDYLKIERRQMELEIGSLSDYGLVKRTQTYFNITGRGVNYLRHLKRKNKL